MLAQTISTYASRTEAELVAARLRAEGIEARVIGDSAGGTEPQFDMVRGVRVVVSATDVESAADVLGIDPPAAPGDLTAGQRRLVSFLQWAALAVAGFGLLTVLLGALD